MNVQDVVNVSIGLSTTPASQAKFTVPILLVDHADIPIDKRYRTVTKSSYATTLTAATAHTRTRPANQVYTASLRGTNVHATKIAIHDTRRTARTPCQASIEQPRPSSLSLSRISTTDVCPADT